MMNLVYSNPGEGWQRIRDGGDGILTTDFVLGMCKERGCEAAADLESAEQEVKDEVLCECAFDECPNAQVYAALCGFGHVRSRLMQYEDSGLEPDTVKKLAEAFNGGRLIVMPCSFGSPLYVVEERKSKKRGQPVTRTKRIRETILSADNFAEYILGGMVGVKVFLTKDEAYAALSKGEDPHE